MNDSSIIEAIKSGQNNKAFNDLYKYFPVIQKMIVSNGGSSIDAQDAFQEALIILCRKVHEIDFKLTSSLNTYLYSVTRFIWKNEMKKRSKTSFVELDPSTSYISFDVNDIYEDEQSAKIAEKAISELSERCRDILKLFYFDQWTMKKIAEKFRYVSEKTAKNQKYKCLEVARKKFIELNGNIKPDSCATN